ncbi:hypothetical protein BLOT_000142 [Blomia tropicalis]|nr:hypothetical protein BLOT_000142 [Blomia tropicalis]
MADGGPKHLNTIQLESYNLFVISQSDRKKEKEEKEVDGDDHRVVKLIIGHMYNDDDDVPRALKNQHSIRSFYLLYPCAHRPIGEMADIIKSNPFCVCLKGKQNGQTNVSDSLRRRACLPTVVEYQ